MKILTAFLLIACLVHNCLGQRVDTVRIYDHDKFGDSWKLEITNNKAFIFYTSNIFFKNEIAATGVCQIGDTSVSFLCDSSKLKNKVLVDDSLGQFSKFPFIVCGNTFRKEDNFLFARHVTFKTEDSIKVSTGIYAAYSRGGGFGGEVIELMENGTYIFSLSSCMGSFSEEGTWTNRKNIITLNVPNYKHSMLQRFTTDRKFYMKDNFLIGKKIQRMITQRKKSKVAETYFFFFRDFENIDD